LNAHAHVHVTGILSQVRYHVNPTEDVQVFFAPAFTFNTNRALLIRFSTEGIATHIMHTRCGHGYIPSNAHLRGCDSVVLSMLLRCAQDSPAQLHGPQHHHHQHHHVGISHGQSPLQPAQFGASPLHAGALARTEGRHMHTHSAIADTWRGCGGGGGGGGHCGEAEEQKREGACGGGGGGGAGAPKDPAVLAHISSQVISSPHYTYSQCQHTF
jgi:hypothetical protein